MPDAKDILWGLFQENINYARHHETLRGTVSNLIIVVSAGVVGIITFDRKIDILDLPLSLFLTAIGVFGAFFTAKHYERYRMHDARLNEIKKRLDALVPEAQVEDMESVAMATHLADFPIMAKLRLNHFWMFLHLLIASLGVVISVLALT